MSNDIWQMPLNEFLNATASDSPTPGGGSVSAVCGAMGLGLVIMALEITNKGPDQKDAISRLLSESRQLLESIKKRADDDVMVFNSYMAAVKLPKITDEQKRTRKEALITCAISATKAPLELAVDLTAALDFAQQGAAISKIQLLSDIAAGADLIFGSAFAALRNVDSNLPVLDDGKMIAEFSTARDQLISKINHLYSKVTMIVKQRLVQKRK